jgi:hypothetical protein
MTKSESLIKLVEDSYKEATPFGKDKFLSMRTDNNDKGQYWEIYIVKDNKTVYSKKFINEQEAIRKYEDIKKNGLLFKGTFNWHGEDLGPFYTHAFSGQQAKRNMMTKVVAQVKYEFRAVQNYFLDKNRYKIEFAE